MAASIDTTRKPADRRRILVSVALALAIVVGAWYVGGSAGFDTIGKGGINQKLLPKVGEQAPDFTAVDLLGNPVTLSDYRGRPVWLNFWGSWCAPCRAEMPDIQTAYQQLQPSGLVLLAVSLDEPVTDAALFAARNEVTFTVLTDPNRSQTGNAYQINNFPTHIFIDADGIVRQVVLAPMSVEDAVGYAEAAIDPA